MNLLKKFASVSGATMASRILGFVREMMIAALLGTGPVADAFYAAFRFPNLFRRLFAEGAFNAAFIPLFAKHVEEGGDEAKKFSNEVFSVLVVILLVVSALAIIFMPWLVGTIVAPKFASDPEKFDLTILLTRIMFPYLAAMSLVAMLAGILNSLRKYFLAAFVPVLLNVVLISALTISQILDFTPSEIGVAMAIGVTISGVLQLALLVWGVRQDGFVPKFQTPKLTPSVRRLLWLALPAAITGGVTQINLLIGQIIASAQAGAIAIINYADRLLQLPLGVIGIAIGVVLLPELARALKAKDQQKSQELQNQSLQFSLLITLPAAVGLAVLSKPIIILLFERGAFDRDATNITAQVLAIFALGLPAFVLNKVFTPAYYARENMRWPMWSSAVGVIINIAGSLILFPTYGVIGIAIATVLSGWANMLMLMVPLIVQDIFLPTSQTLRRTIAIFVAAGIMGIFLHIVLSNFAQLLNDSGFFLNLSSTVFTIATGTMLFFALAMIFAGIKPSEIKSAMSRNNMRRNKQN